MSSIDAYVATAEERGSLLNGMETIDYGTQNEEQPQGDDADHDNEENPIQGGADAQNTDPNTEETEAEAETEAVPPIEPFDEIEQRETERDTMIERLTRRLRCLFSAITWPIVPLGTLVSLCLVWVLYAAFVEDLKSSCSHPLHTFALASMCFLVYAPYHAQIRTHLFRYSRDRDGPIRPTRVRLYDQLFHTLCILYVYGGVTLMQSCKQDFGHANPETGDTTYQSDKNETISMMSASNTCEATCPQLYASLDVYVTMLELFTLSLILPLLFLPCIYLWILRRASSEAEHLWESSLDGNDADNLFGGGRGSSTRRPRVTAAELMQSLETVKLIRRHEDNTLMMKYISTTRAAAATNESSTHNRYGSISTAAAAAQDNDEAWSSDVVKDCCICMSDFSVQEGDDEEAQQQSNGDDTIVRTKCGHVFHTACLGNWIGGRWDPHGEANRRRARRTCCPLCREDLQPAQRARTEPTTPAAGE
jgi:hypothetical protein